MNHYHHTTGDHKSVAINEQKAKTQDELILSLFTSHPELSPSQIYERMRFVHPITSIRRALTNLTKAGKLEKTENMIDGMYRRKEHTWRLIEQIK